MAYLSWHDRYRLDHAEVDAQHLRLFELVNQFDEANRTGPAAEPGRILEDLITCASGHFRFEEELMQQLGFPGSVDHRRVHQELIGQLQDMKAQLRAGGHLSTRALSRFLADWLTNHIIREDLAFKPYLHP